MPSERIRLFEPAPSHPQFSERLRQWARDAAGFFKGVRREGATYVFEHPVQIEGPTAAVRIVDAAIAVSGTSTAHIEVTVDGQTKYLRLYDAP